MSENSFGIYIQTYPGDFHLSSMLVRSIQQVSPDIPIMIIPGEGFDLDNHPFDVPIMPIPTGFWAEIGHQDRDFWAFQGPFEKFLFLDADTICVKSLDGLAQRIVREEGDFIYIQAAISAEDWRSRIENTENPEHNDCLRLVTNEFGTEFLAEFDPDHDFFACFPFNSGAFASRRLAIKEADLALLNQRERAFYKDVLGIEDWTWKSSELFRFRDQGRLNYLVRKLGIPTLPLEPELICIPGASHLKASFDDVQRDSLEFHIIHYMGAKAPSPSFLGSPPLFPLYARLWSFVGKRTGRYVAPLYYELRECPAFSLWRHLYERESGPMRLGERLHWSWPDLRKLLKLVERSIRLLIQRANPS
jgi:hypothetical protein